MKRFKMDRVSYMDASRAWRLGVIHAEKVLGEPVTLADFSDYFGTCEWQGTNGSVYTDMKGQVLQVDIW